MSQYNQSRNAHIILRILVLTAIATISTLPTSDYDFVGRNPTGNPVGGGAGYSNMIDPADATYTVSTKSELLSALSSATSGDIVYVDDNAEIDLTPVDSTTPMTGIIIPAGVTLASGRGSDGSLGAYVYTNYIGAPGAYKLFIPGGDGVRITGLRIDGKEYVTSRGGDEYSLSGGIYSSYAIEVDNNEMSGFSYAAVNIRAAQSNSLAKIHHNYIHHNIRNGYGYGVAVAYPESNTANVLIEANLFDWNRHSITATGDENMNYIARYNIQLGHGTSHAFDVHGDDPNSPSHFGGNAGNTILIYGNTFYPIWVASYQSPPGSYQGGVVIRGVPVNKVEVYDNYFYYDTESSAITQYDWDANRVEDYNYINMSAHDNYFDGVEPTPLCNDGIQNQVETGIDCGGPCISCQAYNDPPVISTILSSSNVSAAAIITWTTNKESDTKVEYGTTTSYGYSTTLDTNLVTSHSQVLFGLSNSTLYHYRVKSKDNRGNLMTSADQTFTTSEGQDPDAIASWKFDENTGTITTDSSGNGNDGTINGATWAAGKVGSALSFNGVNDYVNAGNPTSLQITGAFSMEGWVKLNNLSISSSLFGKGHGLGGSSDYGYFLTYYAPTKGLYFDTYSTTTRDSLFVRPAIINNNPYHIIDNNWHHIAATWDGTTSLNGKKLYIDGALIAQKTSIISSMGNPSYDFRIGIDSLNYYPANATIDEVKVYNRALSASEVFAEYYMGLDSTPPSRSSGTPQ